MSFRKPLVALACSVTVAHFPRCTETITDSGSAFAKMSSSESEDAVIKKVDDAIEALFKGNKRDKKQETKDPESKVQDLLKRVLDIENADKKLKSHYKLFNKLLKKWSDTSNIKDYTKDGQLVSRVIRGVDEARSLQLGREWLSEALSQRESIVFGKQSAAKSAEWNDEMAVKSVEWNKKVDQVIQLAPKHKGLLLRDESSSEPEDAAIKIVDDAIEALDKGKRGKNQNPAIEVEDLLLSVLAIKNADKKLELHYKLFKKLLQKWSDTSKIKDYTANGQLVSAIIRGVDKDRSLQLRQEWLSEALSQRESIEIGKPSGKQSEAKSVEWNKKVDQVIQLTPKEKRNYLLRVEKRYNWIANCYKGIITTSSEEMLDEIDFVTDLRDPENRVVCLRSDGHATIYARESLFNCIRRTQHMKERLHHWSVQFQDAFKRQFKFNTIEVMVSILISKNKENENGDIFIHPNHDDFSWSEPELDRVLSGLSNYGLNSKERDEVKKYITWVKYVARCLDGDSELEILDAPLVYSPQNMVVCYQTEKDGVRTTHIRLQKTLFKSLDARESISNLYTCLLSTEEQIILQKPYKAPSIKWLNVAAYLLGGGMMVWPRNADIHKLIDIKKNAKRAFEVAHSLIGEICSHMTTDEKQVVFDLLGKPSDRQHSEQHARVKETKPEFYNFFESLANPEIRKILKICTEIGQICSHMTTDEKQVAFDLLGKPSDGQHSEQHARVKETKPEFYNFFESLANPEIREIVSDELQRGLGR